MGVTETVREQNVAENRVKGSNFLLTCYNYTHILCKTASECIQYVTRKKHRLRAMSLCSDELVSLFFPSIYFLLRLGRC